MPARRPKLSQEFVRALFDYNPETGVLKWRYRPDRSKRWNSRYAGTFAGTPVKGYLQVQIQLVKKTNYYVHQIAWCWMTGEWPSDQIDHENRTGDDNRWLNLRKANNSQNGCNKTMQSNNKSGFKGVHFVQHERKWFASINVDGKRVWRKSFATAEEAATARAAVLPLYHGEFTRH